MAGSRSCVWASDHGSIIPHCGCHRTSFLSPWALASLSVSSPPQELVEGPLLDASVALQESAEPGQGWTFDGILAVRADGDRCLQGRFSSVTQDRWNGPLRNPNRRKTTGLAADMIGRAPDHLLIAPPTSTRSRLTWS